MCDGGPSGDAGVANGAAVVSGNITAAEAGAILGASAGPASGGGGGYGIGSGSGAAAVGMGAQGGNAPLPAGMDAAQAALPMGSISNSDIATAVGMSPIIGIGALLSAMGYGGAWSHQGDTITSAAIGGPGADPRPAWTQGQPAYAGPPAPPSTAATAPPITIPTIVSGAKYSVERGRSPEEIDAANRLRIAREAAYAKQRAASEADLLKALGQRDIALTGGLGGRFSETRPASEKYVGTPPTLGQSRHYWA